MSSENTTIKLSLLNGHLICGLCGGYLIDATVLTECIHAFCRSCILKYISEHKICPLCQSLIQETRPGHALRQDVALQRVVYKLVPGLLRKEMDRMADFRANISSVRDSCVFPTSSTYVTSELRPPPLPTPLATRSLSRASSSLPFTSESIYNYPEDQFCCLIDKNEFISLSLTHMSTNLPTSCTKSPSPEQRFSKRRSSTPSCPSSETFDFETIYLLCPSVVTVGTLHHLLLAKYQVDPCQRVVDLYLGGECLEAAHSLREVAFLYGWPTRRQPMLLKFAFAEARLAWWGKPMPRLELSHPNSEQSAKKESKVDSVVSSASTTCDGGYSTSRLPPTQPSTTLNSVQSNNNKPVSLHFSNEFSVGASSCRRKRYS